MTFRPDKQIGPPPRLPEELAALEKWLHKEWQLVWNVWFPNQQEDNEACSCCEDQSGDYDDGLVTDPITADEDDGAAASTCEVCVDEGSVADLD